MYICIHADVYVCVQALLQIYVAFAFKVVKKEIVTIKSYNLKTKCMRFTRHNLVNDSTNSSLYHT